MFTREKMICKVMIVSNGGFGLLLCFFPFPPNGLFFRAR